MNKSKNEFHTIKASGWRFEAGYGNDCWRFTTVTREGSPFHYRYFGVRRYTRADVYADMAPDGGAGWYVYEIVNYNGPQHTVTLLGPFRKQGEAHSALYPYLTEQDEDARAAVLTREAEQRLLDPAIMDVEVMQ